MTATCTNPILNDIKQLTGYSLKHCHWPSPAIMSHRSVGIEVKYTHHHFCLLIATIQCVIAPSPPTPNVNHKVIIYTLVQTNAKSISVHLGDYLDITVALHILDIITLVGTMTKEEKAFYTYLFLSDADNPKFNAHIMCATGVVGNAGIDLSKTGVVYRLGMPNSVSDLFHEKGRASQYPNTLAAENCYVICFTIEDLLYLHCRTMDPDKVVLNNNYQMRKVEDLMMMAKVLASDECMCAHVE